MPIILESAEPREVHHFATLLGYGASAVNPYLAHETIREMVEDGLLEKDYYAAVHDYDKAILGGIVKIASKMGISTIQSYQVPRSSRRWASPKRSLIRILPTPSAGWAGLP